MFRLIIDFDETLINNNQRKRDLFSLAEKYGVKLKNSQKIYNEIGRKKIFTIENFAKFLFKEDSAAKKFVGESNKFLLQPRRYNYRGAEGFLIEASKKYILILLSFGNKRFQWSKIKQSELQLFFPKIIIAKKLNKKKELIELRKKYKEKMIIIDDSSAVIEAAKELSIRAIRVKKGKKDSKYYAELLDRIVRKTTS